MSIQESAYVVGMLVGVATLIKISLDIATTPTHRNTAIKWLIISRNFLPAAILFLGMFLSSPGWVFFGLVVGILNFLASPEDHPSRVEMTYFVLFVCLCLIVAQTLVVKNYLDKPPRDTTNTVGPK
jgi:hypothetical protein